MALVHYIKSEKTYVVWCQGCEHGHGFTEKWKYNGSAEKPTFTPSHVQNGKNGNCHILITDGMIEFLSDCAHKFAGQTLPLEDF